MRNNVYALTQGAEMGQGSLYFQYDGEYFSQINTKEEISDLAKRVDTISLSPGRKNIEGKKIVITYISSCDDFFVEIKDSAKDFIGRSVPIVFLVSKHWHADYTKIFLAFESVLPGRNIRVSKNEIFFLKVKSKILGFDFLLGLISWLESKVY